MRFPVTITGSYIRTNGEQTSQEQTFSWGSRPRLCLLYSPGSTGTQAAIAQPPEETAVMLLVGRAVEDGHEFPDSPFMLNTKGF